jgi:CheY-like chemotaxis protein
MNLCNNAVYAMKEKDEGKLFVGIESVVVDETLWETSSNLKPGAYARLYIRDTGRGIEEKNLTQIFNPFFTTKPQGEGTGLGLATAYAVAQNHDGDILVQSEPGIGTVFYIYLPISNQALSLPPRGRKDSSPPPFYQESSERILVVDDDPQVRRMGKRVITQLGYEVVTAQSGKEALDLFEAAPLGYSVIITDYNMPKMTGLELASKLSARGNRVPVILMSGYGDKMTREKIETAGIRVFLQKPANKKQIDKAIRQALEKKSDE